MPTSNDHETFVDCYEILDHAMEDKAGIRVPCSGFGAARHLRSRLHAARALVRVKGRSPYDNLAIMQRQEMGLWWVYLEKTTFGIESLSEIDDGILGSSTSDIGEIDRKGQER